MKPNKSFFEGRIGGSFHYQNYWMDRYAWEIRTKLFFKYINVYKKTILDFGAGSGMWGKEIQKRGSDFIAGIEQSKDLAKNCLIPCQYGFQTLKNKYDLIIAITSLNFTLPKNRKKIIIKLREYLKQDGQLIILEYLPSKVPDFQKELEYKEVWTNKQWKKFMENNGFILEKEIPINWIDTTLFHYFGSNRLVYYITSLLDLLTPIMIYSKYKLQIYKKK
jgi:hypothetical protein